MKDYFVGVLAYGNWANIIVSARNQKEAKEKAINYAMENISFSICDGSTGYKIDFVGYPEANDYDAAERGIGKVYDGRAENEKPREKNWFDYLKEYEQ